MSNKTRVDMIIETLRDHKGEKLTARELAKLFLERYPAEMAEKMKNPNYANDEELIAQLAAEVGGQRTRRAKVKCINIKTREKPRPRLYYWEDNPQEELSKLLQADGKQLRKTGTVDICPAGIVDICAVEVPAAEWRLTKAPTQQQDEVEEQTKMAQALTDGSFDKVCVDRGAGESVCPVTAFRSYGLSRRRRLGRTTEQQGPEADQRRGDQAALPAQLTVGLDGVPGNNGREETVSGGIEDCSQGQPDRSR